MTYLSLHHNPIATHNQYAKLIMSHFPSVRVLDYNKVAKVTPQTDFDTINHNTELSKLKKQLLEAKTMDEVQQIENLIAGLK